MCGIAAIVVPNAKRFEPHVQRMLGAISHRGPDAHGVYAEEDCVLGHRRLIIIDPVCGAQPMISDSGNEIVVFNGELYDYKEQKRRYDYQFKTDSDTELILAAYLKYGEKLCEHLKGMFAFALWDKKKKKLICGRDRFGEKPLYYAIGKNGEFIVASEIKAVLVSELVTPHIDKQGVAAYLRLGFVPEREGVFQEIRQISPGCMLAYANGALKTRQYWSPPAMIEASRPLSELKEEFLHLFKQAVERCQVSDVEVGVLLSGGLDSTTIAAIASQKAKLRSFSFGMAGARNELEFARAAAYQYNLPIEESYIENLDFPKLLQLLPEVYDEPLADSSCLPTLMLCRHVAAHVKTALAGDGGDELLGGYSWYQRLDQKSGKIGSLVNGWTRFSAAHFKNRCFCHNADLNEAGLMPWQPALPDHLADTVDDAMRMDIAGFLPADILKKTDRAAMHYGLELRSPFLDADLASFLIALKPECKINAGLDKWLLRQTFSAMWPEPIKNRAKQGFGINVSDILQRNEVAKLKQELLSDLNSPIYDVLSSVWVKKVSKANNNLAWAVFILALWCRHIKKTGFWNVSRNVCC